jgi:hypothetical protein
MMSPLARILGVALLVTVAVGMANGRASSAQTATGYSVFARADAAGVEFLAPQAPVASLAGGQVAFISPASAQSLLQFGESRAFASVVYPGDLIVGLPGTINGAASGSGENPNLPPYPTYVASVHPVTPSAVDDKGAYRIEANSAADHSDSLARAGLNTEAGQVASSLGRTVIDRDPTTGVVTAEAVAETEPMVFGPLRLGEMALRATVVFDPANASGVQRETSMAIGNVSVDGVGVRLTEDGFEVADTTVPVDASGLADALDAAGIGIELVPAVETPHGITSAGVRITIERELPNLGPTTTRIILGQVSASADPGRLIGGPAAEPPQSVPGLSPGHAPSAGAVSPTGALPSANAGTDSAPIAASQGAVGSTAPRLTAIPGPDLWVFYPVLAAGGLVALVGSRTSALLRLSGRLGTR